LLEGAQGLFAAMSDGADAHNVVANIDDNWRIHDVSFKPWSACRHAHPVLDAALAVLDQVDVNTIEKIVIETYKSAIDFCNKPAPVTEHEAKFSLQHCAAMVFANSASGGKPTLDGFELAQLQLAPLVSLRKRVEVRENIAMSQVTSRALSSRYSCRPS
ncbi:MAG: MmgE/PrpD family protein, partial [Gammaproteobacteria bacterium]|nr:MmgE/PrpD family protein [Gammaproteobacteria bacterium]